MNENCTLQLHNYGTTIVDGFVQFKDIAFMITLLKATYIFISALKINIIFYKVFTQLKSEFFQKFRFFNVSFFKIPSKKLKKTKFKRRIQK